MKKREEVGDLEDLDRPLKLPQVFEILERIEERAQKRAAIIIKKEESKNGGKI